MKILILNMYFNAWMFIQRYDRVYVNGSDFWPKSQNLKENFLNK